VALRSFADFEHFNPVLGDAWWLVPNFNGHAVDFFHVRPPMFVSFPRPRSAEARTGGPVPFGLSSGSGYIPSSGYVVVSFFVYRHAGFTTTDREALRTAEIEWRRKEEAKVGQDGGDSSDSD
jgi:hypothetical protein